METTQTKTMEGKGKEERNPTKKSDRVVVWLLHRKFTLLSILLFAFFLRILVSLHPYSGARRPPMFGDYEAQRHWMEITINIPPREWYKNTTFNHLAYWGLDYPPLTAYQSYFHGIFLRALDPNSVALSSSRGYETPLSKLLMRWTVLSSDALVFFPAALYFVIVYYAGRKDDEVAWQLAMILLLPGVILIDHGHFQYNCISLGLTIGAVAAIISENDVLASVLYCLALNHKQMSAYYAPAFFGHLLGKCIRRKNPLLETMKLGFVVFGTFIIVWWPYLSSVEAILEVLRRLAPFERGIYEDYVANFWCSTSFVIKWKRLFSMQTLRLLSFGATLASILPSTVHQISVPSRQGFLYAMLNSSFSFYLFSFQVHEKSVLLPLVAMSLLALEEPLLFHWFSCYAMLSMYPLLCRDGLVVPYGALLLLSNLLYFTPQVFGGHRRRERVSFGFRKVLMALCLLSFLVIHVIYLSVTPPKRYPFIFEAFIMVLCFSQFVVIAAYTNMKQWMLQSSCFPKEKMH
ncbi:probable dolichyl pyrophosphate Man9GlcNAc2 alpha-1,3-glucosyltransferase [Amborella trichopoda]|nr:probable dolichyl pyrophosphate Man9GlcNAc2 alpha-1,3-glucosyltransferase [Amborella trichopoda]XP_011624760.1 probable dolichyl pyrophosphate Man9GlcNAc2 alpha-1,3-glucosyltransferase [Amborella trichopoda]XP_020525182.1 probable dolichyl pyrophosphate Man9GlcNAc2 alpha-1,3-glucosyltransferase [Amborella trichopoda]XP_020525183.1 probable dolichyl pyrophosphate Man9GlcNAc2 alpha-1,3-glucosyltransferase [Amborella trichopoda]|eukprot:XP_006848211.2 probable dolichyl pyrophosphate Man9GlcNAc2 alpha-1,3-glucosyltransferase [Amborella trichopoda]